MSDTIRDILAANRAAVTKLLPRARRLVHSVVDGPEARQRQLREFAEALYIAQRAVRVGVLRVDWHHDDDAADFGDCQPMAEGTYTHEMLHFSLDNDGDPQTVDVLCGIIVPLGKREARTRQQFEDQMTVENYRAIARAYLAHEAARLSDD